MRANWWGRFWLRVRTWAFHTNAPVVHGGNMAIMLPMLRKACLSVDIPCARLVPPPRCAARSVAIQPQSCVVYGLPKLAVGVLVVCTPSLRVRQYRATIAIAVQLRQIAHIRATLPVSQRVLVSSRSHAVVRARTHLLPKRVPTVRTGVGWGCQARRITPERFQCRNVRSSLAWRLVITRRAVPFRSLAEEQRRQCQEALQRAAKGYVRVESVYYPVPAHAVARIEIDERRGVLYAYPSRGRLETVPACLWVISGVHLIDGRPVRAVLRVV